MAISSIPASPNSGQLAGRSAVCEVILRRRPQEQRSRPRSAYGARRHFPMDLDEFDEAVDAVVGEGHDAFIAEAQDPDEAVLGLHFDGDVEQVVDVLAEVFGYAVDGPDAGDLVDVHRVRPRAAPWPEAVAASSRATTPQADVRDGRRCARGRRRATPADRRHSSYT